MTYAEYVRKEYENGSEDPADFVEWSYGIQNQYE